MDFDWTFSLGDVLTIMAFLVSIVGVVSRFDRRLVRIETLVEVIRKQNGQNVCPLLNPDAKHK